MLRYLEAPGSIGEVEVQPGVKEVQLRIPRLPVVPVSAYPVFGAPPAAVKPSGGVYPSHLDDAGVLSLSWENGLLAEVLIGCAATGDAMQAVNVDKLATELSKKSGGNPWLLDGDMVKRAITRGNLAYNSLRLLPRYEVTMEAASGRWISGNPLTPLPVDCPAGSLTLSGLPEGLHTYFPAGKPGRIDISVTQEGWSAVDMVTGAGSNGKW